MEPTSIPWTQNKLYYLQIVTSFPVLEISAEPRANLDREPGADEVIVLLEMVDGGDHYRLENAHLRRDTNMAGIIGAWWKVMRK
jgi:hypothetical protein